MRLNLILTLAATLIAGGLLYTALDRGPVQAQISVQGGACSGTNTYEDGGGNCDTLDGAEDFEVATDDGLMVGDGTGFGTKVIPDCDGATTDKVLYDTATNTFTCGTDQGGAGSADVDAVGDCASGDCFTSAATNGNEMYFTGTDTGDGFEIKLVGAASGADFTVTIPAETGTVCVGGTGAGCPAGAGDISDVYGCAAGDCDTLVASDGDELDFSAVNPNSAAEGIMLPQTTTCTGTPDTGAICYGTTLDEMCVYDGAGWDCVALSSNAATATALASNPTDCSANQFADAIDAAGDLTCNAITDADVPDSITVDAATALSADPSDCAANTFAQSIVANGNLTCAGIVDADVPDGITISLSTTATALAANPADCAANEVATTIAASGALTCVALTDDYIPDSITVDNATLAASATALAADPANCVTSTEFAVGVTAAGVATCEAIADADVPDTITIDLATTATTATTANDLAAGIITEGDLSEDSGTPLDEDVLTYDSVGTNFNWVAQSGLAAGTAAALAADPADCVTSTHFAVGVTAAGVATCEAIGDADVPDTITVTLASTATALAANPADCGPNQVATTIAASGALTCVALTDSYIPNTITVDDATLAASATVLAANPADCSVNQYANAIAASGDLTCSALVDGDIPDTITVDLATLATTATLATGATALAANPSDCGANQFAHTIAANGNLTCSALVDADIPDGITVNTAGTAGTATALASNPTDCSADQFATAIDASGNLTCGAASGSGDVTDVFGCASGDCSEIAASDLDHLDFSSVIPNVAGEGISLPQTADCTTPSGTPNTGAICYGTTNDELCVWSGTEYDCQVLGVTDTNLLDEAVEDLVGAMFTGNTETGITVTYQDATADIDLTLDTNLTDLSALAKTDDNMIVANGATWVAETGATLRASIGDYALASEVSGTLPVGNGGTGATTLTDGGVLLGNGTGTVVAMAVLANSAMIVGDGTTDPVAESGATLRTSIGVDPIGTDNSTNVTLAGTPNYLTLSGQAITLAVLDAGDDTNLTAGVGLTLTNDDVLADASLYTDTKCFYLEDPVSSELFSSVWRAGIAATITEIWCETDAGTVTLDLEIDDGSPAGVNGSNITCTTSPGTADGTLGGDVTILAGQRLDLQLATVTTATRLSVCWTYTYDQI